MGFSVMVGEIGGPRLGRYQSSRPDPLGRSAVLVGAGTGPGKSAFRQRRRRDGDLLPGGTRLRPTDAASRAFPASPWRR